MTGRLHYATIAISIFLVAILYAVTLTLSNAELQPIEKHFASINLNQKETLPSSISNIKNINELTIDGSNKALNLLYKIPKQTPQTDNPILVVKPGYINVSTLYSLRNNTLTALERQSRYKFESNPEFIGYARIFKLKNIQKNQPNSSIYLNITHSTSAKPDVELWDYETYNRVDNQYNQVFTAILFGIFLLILVNCFFYLIIRRKEYLLYIFYNSLFLLFLMGTSGYIYQFPALSFLASSKNTLFAIFSLSLFALYSFSQEFMSTKTQAIVEHKILNAFKYTYLVLFGLSFIIVPITQLFINILNAMSILVVPLYIWLLIKLLLKNNRQAFFFALAFFLLIITAVLRVFTTFGILPETFMFNHGFAIASLLEATIFTLGLADRVLQIKVQRDSAQKESMERSQAYELQKDFSTLLNNITQKLHNSKSSEYEEVVLNTFLNELSHKVNFVTGAAIYQMDSRLHIYTRKNREKEKYKKIIKNNSLQVNSVCDIGLPQRLKADPPFDNLFIIPVAMRRHEWSCLILEVPQSFHPTESMLDFLQHYATELIRCLLNIESLRLIKTQAETDGLTHLLNRNAVIERLKLQLVRSQRMNSPLSIAFVDVDDFKQINDTFGHEAGDLCLQNLAKLFLEELPKNVVVGRYGGDEFLIIFPNTNKKTARAHLDNVSRRIIPLIMEHQSCNYTLSIGISSVRSNTKDTLQLIREADKALYVSKNEGKNQINLASP